MEFVANAFSLRNKPFILKRAVKILTKGQQPEPVLVKQHKIALQDLDWFAFSSQCHVAGKTQDHNGLFFPPR